MRNLARFAACLLVLGWAVAGAQTRISIRPEPKPGQTIHVTSTQAISISIDAGVAAGQPAAAQIMTEAVLGYTQVNGSFDDQGRMESQLTVEHFDMKQSLNGIPKPTGDIPEFLGSSITAVFDRSGKLVDIKVPKDLEQDSPILKQMVAGANGAVNLLPAEPMSIGEDGTVSSNIPMRLPGSASPASYQTRTVTTLRGVEKNGSDRVAHFEQRLESDAGTELVKLNGTGTIDLNLDRGFVASSASEVSFAAAQPGAVHGSIKVTVAAHE